MNTYTLRFANAISVFIEAPGPVDAVMQYVSNQVRLGEKVHQVTEVLYYKKPKTNLQIATELIAAVLSGDGVTIDRFGDTPTAGYVVGVEGTINVDDINDVTEWVAKFEGTQYLYGAWKDADTGSHYFDAVEVYDDLQEALKAGHDRGEIAIWDLANEVEIRVEYV